MARCWQSGGCMSTGNVGRLCGGFRRLGGAFVFEEQGASVRAWSVREGIHEGLASSYGLIKFWNMSPGIQNVAPDGALMRQ